MYILVIIGDNYDGAFEKIEKASKLIPDKMDPYLYKACLIV
jgi:hypothetical protein